MKLLNKIAVITGGASGIGLETAKLFAEEGARVVVIDSSEETLAQAARELHSSTMLLHADLRKPPSLTHAFEEVEAEFGQIDVLFANAAEGKFAELEDITLGHIEEHFSLNVTGLLLSIQKVVPIMPSGGSVIATTSFLNTVGIPGLSIFSATKAAVRSLVRTLGAELAPNGIRVNAVSPGTIDTPFCSNFGLRENRLDTLKNGIHQKVPTQRFGAPIDVARAVLFLASGESTYMTGAEVVVDGGLTQF